MNSSFEQNAKYAYLAVELGVSFMWHNNFLRHFFLQNVGRNLSHSILENIYLINGDNQYRFSHFASFTQQSDCSFASLDFEERQGSEPWQIVGYDPPTTCYLEFTLIFSSDKLELKHCTIVRYSKCIEKQFFAELYRNEWRWIGCFRISTKWIVDQLSCHTRRRQCNCLQWCWSRGRGGAIFHANMAVS